MSFLLTGAVGRTFEWAGTIYEVDGTTVVTAAVGSVLRFKAGRRPAGIPVLDLDSAGGASGGSILTYTPSTGAYTLKITGDDTEGLVPGVYDAELALVDHGESDRIKVVERGTLYLQESLAGDLGTS